MDTPMPGPLADQQMCPRCSRNSQRGSKFCGNCGQRFNPQMALLPAGYLLDGRFRVQRLLGMGNMGAVYAVEQIADGTVWALKSLFDLTLTEQFYLEAHILRALRDAHLPQVIAIFEQDNAPYFVMEYLDGKSLGDIVAEKRRRGEFLPVSTVVRWGTSLCHALFYLHSQVPPIIHRDIKPDNVKFTPQGEIKLVDFGLVKLFDPARGSTSRLIGAMGSEGYTPYEQYLNNGSTGPTTDIYALGATLYTLLTNTIPPDPVQRQQDALVLQPPSAINPLVSPALDAAILTSMAFNAADRFTSATMCAAALAAAVPTATLPPRPAPPPAPPAPPASAPVLRLRGGAVAHTPSELARVLERNPAAGMFHLYNGDLAPWLRQIGRADLARSATAIRTNIADQRVGLESMVRLLDPALPPPRLTLSATALSFGMLFMGTRADQPLTVRNTGRGYLHGRIESQVPWLFAAPPAFGCDPGQSATLTIVANLSQRRGSVPLFTGNTGALQTSLLVHSNGGTVPIPISVQVRRRGLLWVLGGR